MVPSVLLLLLLLVVAPVLDAAAGVVDFDDNRVLIRTELMPPSSPVRNAPTMSNKVEIVTSD